MVSNLERAINMQENLISNLETNLKASLDFAKEHSNSKLAVLQAEMQRIYALVQQITSKPNNSDVPMNGANGFSAVALPTTFANSNTCGSIPTTSIASNNSNNTTSTAPIPLQRNHQHVPIVPQQEEGSHQQQENYSNLNNHYHCNNNSTTRDNQEDQVHFESGAAAPHHQERKPSSYNNNNIDPVPISDAKSPYKTASDVMSDEDANRIMHNFLIAVSKLTPDDMKDVDEDEMEELMDDSDEFYVPPRIASRRGRARAARSYLPHNSISSTSPRATLSSIGNNNSVIYVEFQNEKWLTHKDLTSLTRIKYPLNEALVKNYKKETGREAFIWTKLDHFDELAKQHPGIKRNHFQGPNKAMRLFSIEFMEYLKKGRVA